MRTCGCGWGVRFTSPSQLITMAAMKRSGIFFVVALSSGAPLMAHAAAAPDECANGLQSYMVGDYAKALKTFEAAAKKNDGCAQFQLGMMHMYGRGTKKDDAKAIEWFKKSAASGFEKAQMQLSQTKP
jgi:TPR repeat protein